MLSNRKPGSEPMGALRLTTRSVQAAQASVPELMKVSSIGTLSPLRMPEAGIPLPLLVLEKSLNRLSAEGSYVTLTTNRKLGSPPNGPELTTRGMGGPPGVLPTLTALAGRANPQMATPAAATSVNV